jgi:sec-independent protein translocase protein TatA
MSQEIRIEVDIYMEGLGWQELLVILFIALIFFGPSKLPEIGKTLGKTIKSFKDSMNKISEGVKEEINQINDSTDNLQNK